MTTEILSLCTETIVTQKTEYNVILVESHTALLHFAALIDPFNFLVIYESTLRTILLQFMLAVA